MALIRALNSAISGLSAQQFRIDVIGDNLANVDTTGFKAARSSFETVLSQTLSFGTAPQGFLGGIDPKQLGLGVKVGNTTKNFAQGNLKATGTASDLAMEGDGFFIEKSEDGENLYTRDGSFTLNPSNYLHSPSSGYIVQGWMADFDTFEVQTGGPVTNLEVPVGDLRIAKETDNVIVDGNLNGAGEIATSGTVLESEALWDFTAGAAAGLNTALVDLGKNGGGIDFSLSAGDVISFTADKSGSSLPVYKFEISALPPAPGNDYSGTTLGDFIGFVQKALGVNASGDATYSASITTGSLDIDGVGADDTITANGMTLMNRDLWEDGVRVGDFIRFTSGDSAGLILQVSGILSDDSPYGAAAVAASTTITFQSPIPGNITLPGDLDMFEFNEQARVALGNGNILAVPAAGTDPDSAAGVIRVAGNAGLYNEIKNLELTANGQQLMTFNETASASGEGTVTNMVAYDSLGNAHTIKVTFAMQSKNDDGNTFKWFAESQDSSTFGTAIGTGYVKFDANGKFFEMNPGGSISLDLGTTGSSTPLVVTPDFMKVTGFANGISEVAMVDQDGFAQGTLSDYAISTDGYITGFFTNGLTRTIGQMAVARFQNNNGLIALGSNLYAPGTNSGEALVGTPGSFARGLIRSGFLEESNVDMAREFTNLIVSQRAYQANARTITVANQMLQDLVNMI